VEKINLVVDYDRSVENGIKAGKYDWSDASTTEITTSHFPSEETGTNEISMELVHFGQGKTVNEVLSELDKMIMRSATLKELLAMGEKFPDLQRESPIIALGSVWQISDDRRLCASLGGSDSGRFLGLVRIGDQWSVRCRFAAVRK